ncbi:cation:proton antiporter [Altererythrobacter lauratis]|uniref:Cation:proton antiporter n=1 Tax=Alteraurantiacibacter lauratis TaxID=2054627 RepID=A0ABV7EG57_9SPHN
MHQFVVDFAILLTAALAAVLVAVRLHLSPTVGYLLAGIIAGPGAWGLVGQSASMVLLAELGIAVLMFFIGLEFSWSRLMAERRSVFGFGGAQVALTATLAGALLQLWAGLDLLASLIIGGALAMSSTAIVHKHLIEREESATRFGIASTGALVLQDVAALALLGALAVLAGPGGHAGEGAGVSQLVVGFAALAAVALLARPTLGRLLALAARTRSNEVFLITALAILLAAALGAEKVGLSLPLGAFVVGVILAESDFRHQLEEEIRPFRDLLLGIFFITTGMSLDLGATLSQPLVVLAGAIAIVLGKFVLVWLIALAQGQAPRDRVRSALLLAHCGELSLLLLGQATIGGALPVAWGQPLLSMVALSMILGAVIVHFSPYLTAMLARSAGEEVDHTGEADSRRATSGLTRHVILVGCGTKGRTLAQALEASGTPYVAIERDYECFKRARSEGLNVIFGDGQRKALIEAAGLDRASALVLFVRRPEAAARLLHDIGRDESRGCAIIASCRDSSSVEALLAAGATYVFPESLAASLALAREAMRAAGMAEAEVDACIRTLRQTWIPAEGLLEHTPVRI